MYIIIVIFILYLLYKIYTNKREKLSELNITKQINILVNLINTTTLEYIYQEQRYKYNYLVDIIIDKDKIVFNPQTSQIQSYELDDLSNNPKPGLITINFDEKEQKYYLTKNILFEKQKLVRKIDITQNINNLINILKDYQIEFLPNAIQVKGANIKIIVNKKNNSINYYI
jgi:hypothetical protein